MAARLAEVEEALERIEAELARPDTSRDVERLADLGRRHSELKPLVDNLRRYRQLVADLSDAGDDAELADMVHDLIAERDRVEEELRQALLPTDPDSERDVIIEVRAAAGGDEASLWAGDLLRMYEKYAEAHRFKVEPLDSSPADVGGYDKVSVAIKGKGAFARFKYEAGVHRVQRVPKTESQGRIHTSTATVAVLPEVAEVDVEIGPGDVKVDVYRSTGPGGQSVNTTDSAVRLTHLPTGLMVTCQDEKSQLQNKEKAFRILRARLYQAEQERRREEVAGARRSQVGSGGRSEKIRTYNFKENRVTDHRIGLTVRRLDQILEGDLDDFIDALIADEQTAALAGEDGTN